ncbi:MAG: O-antigen ligase family protein, partial [Bacteroidia bacterium]|nr:O-antigen ligase family protein [Bacteroidia bacterium]
MKSEAFNKLNQIQYYSLLVLAAFPMMPKKIQSIAIIAFVVISFIGVIQLNKELFKRKLKWILLFSSISLIYGALIFFSDDTSSAVFQTEKRLSLLVIPFAFLFWNWKLDVKQLNAIKTVFVASCFLVVLRLLGILIYADFFQEAWNHPNFSFMMRNAAESITGFHPSYLALYLSFSICILLLWLLFPKQQFKKHTKGMMVIGVLVFVILIWLLAARMPLLGLFIALLAMAFWKAANIKRFALVSVVLIAVLFAAVFFSPSLKERSMQLINSGFSMPADEDFNDTNVRLAIYTCSLKLLKENWHSGYQPGDVYQHLNECYESTFNSDKLREKNFNTHNEYFNIWLGCGIIGFALFLMMLFLPLKMALRADEKLYVLFLILFMVSCLTENVLSRQHG